MTYGELLAMLKEMPQEDLGLQVTIIVPQPEGASPFVFETSGITRDADSDYPLIVADKQFISE